MDDMAKKGSFKEGDITIRAATPADYRDVDSIECYKEIDYIHGGYHAFLASPYHTCYVAEHKGKVIGFLVREFIEGTMSVNSAAGRFRKEYQGKGLAYLLVDGLMKEVWKKHPNLDREVFAYLESKQNYQANLKLANTVTGYRVERKQVQFMYVIDRVKLVSLLTLLRTFLRALDIEKAPQHLSRDSWQKELQESSNFEDIIGRDGNYYMYYTWLCGHTNKKCLQRALEMSHVMVNREVPGNATSRATDISMSCITKAPEGERIDINYYGLSTDDCLGHLYYQLNLCLREARDDTDSFYLILLIPLSVDANKIEKMISDVLGKRFQYHENESPTLNVIASVPLIKPEVVSRL